MKFDPKDMQFSAPCEWLIWDMKRKKFWDGDYDISVRNSEITKIEMHCPDSMYKPPMLEEGDLCGFTGYLDSEGSKVFGGDILKSSFHDGEEIRYVYHLIFWSVKDGTWRFKNINGLHEGRFADYMRAADDIADRQVEIIAHILQPDGWPREVRRLLE